MLHFDSNSKLIPLNFILGFYVSFVVGRWWNWYNAIPWPDAVAHAVAAFVGQI